MKHVSALIIKFIITTVLVWIVLYFFRVPFTTILWMSLVLTVAAYLLGDLLVLPLGGNLIAAFADFGLSLVMMWLMGLFVFDRPVHLVVAAFAVAILTVFGEWFFHRYLKNRLLNQEKVEW